MPLTYRTHFSSPQRQTGSVLRASSLHVSDHSSCDQKYVEETKRKLEKRWVSRVLRWYSNRTNAGKILKCHFWKQACAG